MENTGLPKEEDQVATYRVVKTKDEKFLPYIRSTWLRTLRRKNRFFKLIDASSYYVDYSKYINFVLSKPDTVILVALLSDDEDVSLGWSVYEKDKLHYVYVKSDLRRIGIAKSLFPPNIKTITHITRIDDDDGFWLKKYPQFKFIP